MKKSVFALLASTLCCGAADVSSGDGGFPVDPEARGHENTEWSISYAYHLNDARLFELRENVGYDDIPEFPSWKRESVGQRARFGLIADVHLDLGYLPPYRCTGRSERVFRTALEYLKSRGVDGVVLAGDMTRIGQIAELKRVKEIWDEVFPGGRRPDGEAVTPLFIFGDHEVETFDSPGGGYEKWFAELGIFEKMRSGDIAVNDRAKVWREVFGEEFAPIRRVNVKGYDFVLAHFVTQDVDGARPGEPTWIPGLEEFFATNRFDGVRPFFYVQHKLPRGTVGGPNVTGQDIGRTTALLSRYPNAVGFCGHKHRSATEELSLWQGAFTQALVPAVSGLLTAPGRENSRSSCEAPVSVPPQQMMPLEGGADGSQALVMTVCDDRLVFERVDVLHDGEPVAAPWIVPWPNDGGAAFEKRGERAPVPRFALDARVTAAIRRGRDRAGSECDQVEVRFPQTRRPRAYDYEVTAVLTKGDTRRIVRQKRVYSPACHLSEARDTNDVVCVFGKGDLCDNHDSIVFEVRPANAWGRQGEAIATEPASYYRRPAKYPY